MGEKLQKLEAQRAQLQERIKRLRAKEVSAARKAETRKKIIAGAALLKLLQDAGDDLTARRVWNACLQRMSERDRGIFQ